MADYVACPCCGSADNLMEQQLKNIWQSVVGLQRNGDADDYQLFDYSDQTVVGYSCGCGWIAITEMSQVEINRISLFVESVLQSMSPRSPDDT